MPKAQNPMGVFEQHIMERVLEELDKRGFVGSRLSGGTVRGEIPLASLPVHDLYGTKHGDVNTATTPVEGDVLVYLGGKWTAAAIALGSLAGEILTDDAGNILVDSAGNVLYEDA